MQWQNHTESDPWESKVKTNGTAQHSVQCLFTIQQNTHWHNSLGRERVKTSVKREKVRRGIESVCVCRVCRLVAEMVADGFNFMCEIIFFYLSSLLCFLFSLFSFSSCIFLCQGVMFVAEERCDCTAKAVNLFCYYFVIVIKGQRVCRVHRRILVSNKTHLTSYYYPFNLKPQLSQVVQCH